jgi:magnesium-transporting ATPase (P-type)
LLHLNRQSCCHLPTCISSHARLRACLPACLPACLQVRAIRHGREQALPVRKVAVGDLLLVETGDILCTDGLLVAGSDVK